MFSLLKSSAWGAVGLLAAVGFLACDDPGGPARPGPSAPPDGAALYASQCASCHGGQGQGRRGPALAPWHDGRDALVAAIADTMPFGAPADCVGACAEAVADYVLTLSGELQCDAPGLPPRRLRLLSRREHAAAIRDLLAPLGGTSGADPCTDGTTFRFVPPRAVSSVSVAGTFNGWDPAAWPMREEGGAWTLTRVVPEGRHEYKIVLDGSEWVADPSASATAPDGFGGVNSVLDVRCGGASGVRVPDVTSALPPETRPEAYPFDLAADVAYVSSVHVEEYLAAAKRVADAVGDAVVALAPGDEAAFVHVFGRRAFRRPLSEGERERYVSLARAEGDATRGRLAVLRAMLASPAFLYRSEVGAPDGVGYRLDAFEMASALSFSLLGTTPPDALLDAAERGELDDERGVRAAAEGLLDDARAEATMRAFARMWLGVEELGQLPRDTSPALRAKLREATERFVAGVMLGGRVDELFTSGALPADADVAAAHGASAPERAWDAVELPPERRAGVLGHASVQLRYAHSDQTSPIARGVFVRRRLLCQDFAPPPPEAGGVPEVDPTATTRERFRQHTESATCASCHQYIDDLGFGFEGFDHEGRPRREEHGLPIDTSGLLRDVEGFGTRTEAIFSGLPELGAALAASDAAPSCFATQWWRFAHGALEREEDECLVREVGRTFAAGDRSVRALLVEVLASERFRRRSAALEEVTP
ncbi:MAG: DUF1588 domain-containing protein [Myxococcales bacterium]|nr:DUF1588 domain-containing protein [Myxococcales bacterium]